MKTWKLTLLFFSLLGIFTSCKNNNEPTSPSKYTFDLGRSVFYGKIYDSNSNVFDLYLMDSGLDIDNQGYIIGSGYFLYFDLNTPINTTAIPNGTYAAGTDGSNYTFQKGSFYTYTGTQNRPQEFNHPEGSYLAKVVDGEAIEFYLINSGSMVINGNSITGKLISTDNVTINFSFNGNIQSIDDITPFPNNLSKGELWYWGNADNVGLNVFTIRLGDSNTNMTELTGGGDMMMIEVYTPLTVMTYLPDGVYPVRVNSPEVQTTIDGYLDNGNYYGTWYFTPARDYAITQGSLTVQHKTGNTYNLAFDFKDENNYSIVHSAFDISLGYYDKTIVSGVKQMMRMPKQKTSAQKNAINVKHRINRTK
ncbi:exported hypothetical protein [uncultured Paludibacter sp.]|nr:exported hypothetical protein [uncultured Paludibacter sp.]